MRRADRAPRHDLTAETFEPDPNLWVPLAEIHSYARRIRQWTGAPGTEWFGCRMTLEILTEPRAPGGAA